MKTIFASTVVTLLTVLGAVGQVDNARERCEIRETVEGDRGWAQYYDSPDGKIGKNVYMGRQLGSHGGFVVESTHLDSRRKRWAEISHWTLGGRKQLGWVKADFLSNCVPYRKVRAEEEWLHFFPQFKNAVESDNLEQLKPFLDLEFYQALRKLNKRQLHSKLLRLKEILNRGEAGRCAVGRFRWKFGCVDIGPYDSVEVGSISIGLIRRVDSGGDRGYGWNVNFWFEDGTWRASFSDEDGQISGPG